MFLFARVGFFLRVFVRVRPRRTRPFHFERPARLIGGAAVNFAPARAALRFFRAFVVVFFGLFGGLRGARVAARAGTLVRRNAVS